MKAPRVSMASLCVFIGIVAVNLAWPRFLIVGNKGSLLGFGDGDYAVLDLGVLGMLDICVLAFYGLRRGPFRIGFVIGGVFAVLAFACLCWLAPRVFAWDFILARGIMPVDEWLMRHLPSVIPSYSPRKTRSQSPWQQSSSSPTRPSSPHRWSHSPGVWLGDTVHRAKGKGFAPAFAGNETGDGATPRSMTTTPCQINEH